MVTLGPWLCVAGYRYGGLRCPDATEFVKVIENRQGIKISAIEEIAYKNGWISEEQLLEAAVRYGKSAYGAHLKKVAEHKIIY